jgi:hypothetical protein
LVGVTWNLFGLPGTMSIFMRKAGTQKEWMTSREYRSNWTVSPTGRYRVGRSSSTPA